MTKRSVIYLLACLLFQISGIKAQISTSDFVSTWVTDRSDIKISNDSTVIIFVNPVLQYNYDVDWDNDGVFEDTSITDSIIHQYPSADTFTIRIRGEFPHIYFGRQIGNSPKLLAIEQWGDYYWKSMEESFSYTNMWINDTLPPRLDSVTSCAGTFRKSTVNSDLSSWDVSGVIDMSRMFKSAKQFNQDISKWDVSSVQFMEQMFMDADVFNQPLNSWDVSNVISVAGMFTYASAFNQPLDQWDVSNVVDMNDLFYDAGSFDQDISMWDVSNVLDMSGMFAGTLINYDLNSWDVSKVVDMSRLFQTPTFNGKVDQWDVSNVENMRLIFGNAETFNQDISNWDVSNVRDMSYMFNDARAFNQDISSWQVDSVRSFSHMFQDALSFNQDIGGWNVQKATDFSFMFQRAISFNQDLSNWNTPSAGLLTRMFKDAIAFDQDLSSWKVHNVTNMYQMLDNCGLSIVNYDSTLIGWSSQAVQFNVELGAENLIYCKGDSARIELISSGWNINGDTLDCPVGLSEQGYEQEQEVQIWPNPASELLNILIDSKKQEKRHLRSFDSKGRIILEEGIYQNSHQINLSRLPKGFYLLKIGNTSKRLILE